MGAGHDDDQVERSERVAHLFRRRDHGGPVGDVDGRHDGVGALGDRVEPVARARRQRDARAGGDEHARNGGWKIIPLCPFARAQFERHPQWRDVLSG